MEAKVNRLEALLHEQSDRFNFEIDQLKMKNEQLTKRLNDAHLAQDDGSNNDKLGGLRRNNEAGNSGLKRAITSPPPTSCVSLYQLGNQISGFYLVKDNMAGNSIQTIYCDFNFLSTIQVSGINNW